MPEINKAFIYGLLIVIARDYRLMRYNYDIL